MADLTLIKEESVKSKPSMISVCLSESLDDLLKFKKLNSVYDPPSSTVVHYVSDRTTGMPLPTQNQFCGDVGLNAGLGLKRKNEGSQKNPFSGCKKPKTLGEKRRLLEEQIEKYGFSAVEQFYTSRSISRAKSPIELLQMKPKTEDFEEIDAQKILRPHSHSKYIHQPDDEQALFISRRKGLVPLSSLRDTPKTASSSTVQLLSGRNARDGKPSVFVRVQGRMIAIGGSRSKDESSIRVLKMSAHPFFKASEFSFTAFEMDEEYVEFALKALPSFDELVLKSSSLYNNDQFKKMKRARDSILSSSFDLQSVLKKKTIVDHVYDKIQLAASSKEDWELLEAYESAKNKVSKSFSTSISLPPPFPPSSSSFDKKKQSSSDLSKSSSKVLIHNPWPENPKIFYPLPDPEGKPTHSEQFKKELSSRNQLPLNGFSSCDVENCFCICKSALTAETPLTDGTQTPSEIISLSKKTDKVLRNLKKVKRALKNLGANVIEFETGMNPKKNCDKEHCRLGCVCESISEKTIPPSHCGKVECMFHCLCSEDALKKFLSARKVGISLAGFEKLQEKTQWNMASEEKKFHNTIVTMGGKNLFLLSGRQKRERKVPTRYQDSSEPFVSDSKDISPSVKSSEVKNSEDTSFSHLLSPSSSSQFPQSSFPSSSSFSSSSSSFWNPLSESLRKNGLKMKLIKKVCVLVPKLKDRVSRLRVWCMYHNVYTCPCTKYKNPLDYAPDVNQYIRAREPNKRPFKVSESHCARTFGFLIHPSFAIKIPHNFQSVSDVLRSLFRYSDPHSPKILSFSALKTLLRDKRLLLTYSVLRDVLYLNKYKVKQRKSDVISLLEYTSYKDESRQRKDILELVPRKSEAYSLLNYIFNSSSMNEVQYNNNSNSNNSTFCRVLLNENNWNISSIFDKTTYSCLYVLNPFVYFQKLPLGLSRISLPQSTLVLPPTSRTQYWTATDVRIRRKTNTCPLTGLKLDFKNCKKVLRSALSKGSSLQIPIVTNETQGSSIFIFVSPTLMSHVFLGPFDESFTSFENGNSPHRRKQRLLTKLDEEDRKRNRERIEGILESLIKFVVILSEEKKKRRILESLSLFGSVPLEISYEKESSHSLDIVSLEEEENKDENWRKHWRNHEWILLKGQRLPYQHLPFSDHGKIFISSKELSEFQYGPWIEIPLGSQKTFKVKISPRSFVIFPHPTFPHHIVMCSSTHKATLWMKEHLYDARGPSSFLSIFDKVLKSEVVTTNKKDTFVMTRRKRKSISRKKNCFVVLYQNELRRRNNHLFYQLSQFSSFKYIRKKLCKSDILKGAKNQILSLQRTLGDLREIKTDLLKKRSLLFESFTESIENLPKDVKKTLVKSLKDGLVLKREEKV